jgi:hypothetical protein
MSFFLSLLPLVSSPLIYIYKVITLIHWTNIYMCLMWPFNCNYVYNSLRKEALNSTFHKDLLKFSQNAIILLHTSKSYELNFRKRLKTWAERTGICIEPLSSCDAFPNSFWRGYLYVTFIISVWIKFDLYKFRQKANYRTVTSVSLILRNTLPSYNRWTARLAKEQGWSPDVSIHRFELLRLYVYRVFREQADLTLRHMNHKGKEQSTTEASITLTDSLIRWSPNELPSVCLEIPVYADNMLCTSKSLRNEHSILSVISIYLSCSLISWVYEIRLSKRKIKLVNDRKKSISTYLSWIG